MNVLVAMSGGVDSSVTAALLKEQGHEIVGLFMRNGVTAGTAAASNKQGCCSLADSQDARFVASQLGARFYVLNFAEDFQRVIDYFVSEYKRGRTPNPCAVCNTDLKFGKLLDYARAVGAEKVATGHYARVDFSDGRWRLYRGADRSKDQSYYLFGLTQEQLSRALFPLGGLTKPQVRELAGRFELKTRDKAESMEICFVPEGDYRAVVAKHSPDALVRGEIVSTSGEKLGEHDGIAGFTIGQRRGIGIAAPKALYVVKLEPETNTVVVGDLEDLEIERIRVAKLNWIAFKDLAEGQQLRAIVKVRYRHEGDPATIIGGKDSVEVKFDQPIKAATPGQCAVFYAPDSDEVLGGGWIA
ncbi:MAG: tRNA 2-thiouridine(34) synthase MnmA [Planctomycetes bacterium]|nr:tRNA 2-thiouridine(34) synthase MnmA [Planctomycetota bacterium]MCB9936530.1 tRNA 2-thiouridine(34) synthase MnmA [Planctomycetota bacterium]